MIDYSIIVPAYNEENFLPETLTAIAAAMNGYSELNGEVIVVDNNSTDATADIAEKFGAKVIFEPENHIAKAKNRGAAAAAGRYLIFIDADTLLSVELLLQALDNLQNAYACGGGVVVNFSEPHTVKSYILRTAPVWNFIARTLKLAAGCFIYCRTDAFQGIGGFNEQLYIGEDIDISRRLRRWGRKQRQHFIIITEPPIKTSPRKAVWHSPVKLLLINLLLLCFPPAWRWRCCCSLWYRRPNGR